MKRSATFDYPYSCPDIDSNIEKFKEVLFDNVYDMLERFCPELDDKKQHAEEYTDYIYNSSQDIFEEVRKCNSNMRDAAEDQVGDLGDELEEAQSRADYYEDEADDLKDTISYLEEEIDELKLVINDI